jgi:uncharacterized protein
LRGPLERRVSVVPLVQRQAVMFAVNQRTMQGKHGVSELRSGHGHTLGINFHDAT